MRPSHWIVFPAAVVSAASHVHATQYLTLDEAQKALFPSAHRFDSLNIVMSKDQRTAIQKAARVSVPSDKLNVWKVMVDGREGGYFWVDRVIGKHEFITYAVALNMDGSVRQVEIMDYRETYGGEVRKKAWRDQFVGKTAAAPLKLDADVMNISGATLSCRNIANGIRRILATYEIVLNH